MVQQHQKHRECSGHSYLDSRACRWAFLLPLMSVVLSSFLRVSDRHIRREEAQNEGTGRGRAIEGDAQRPQRRSTRGRRAEITQGAEKNVKHHPDSATCTEQNRGALAVWIRAASALIKTRHVDATPSEPQQSLFRFTQEKPANLAQPK